MKKIVAIALLIVVLAGGAFAAKAYLPILNPTYALEASMVSVGTMYTCAVEVEGGAFCWGANYSGNLGNGSVGKGENRPAPVVGLQSDVTDISTGWSHTCAVQSGAAKCWGSNSSGELGNGATVDSAVPVQVLGLESNVLSVRVGTYHTCALTTAGAVYCWGLNGYPESWKISCCILGDGTTEPLRLTPSPVVGLQAGVKAISATDYNSCALTNEGLVGCWGTHQNPRTPSLVSGLPEDIVSISAGGNSTCAVTREGRALCWGDNGYGQLGDGSTNSSEQPIEVFGLGSGAVAIDAGGLRTCALTHGGSARCWGSGGALGNGSEGASLIPVPVIGPKYVSISAGGFHVCAIAEKSAGFTRTKTEKQPGTDIHVVECWGDNSGGQLGDGTDRSSLKPVPVSVRY